MFYLVFDILSLLFGICFANEKMVLFQCLLNTSLVVFGFLFGFILCLATILYLVLNILLRMVWLLATKWQFLCGLIDAGNV